MVKAHCHLFAKNGDGLKYEYEKLCFGRGGGGEWARQIVALIDSKSTFIYWLLINKLTNHCRFSSQFVMSFNATRH